VVPKGYQKCMAIWVTSAQIVGKLRSGQQKNYPGWVMLRDARLGQSVWSRTYFDYQKG